MELFSIRIQRTFQLVSTVQIGFQPTGLYPRSFAISPDGCYLAVVCRDANCIQIFERNRNTGLLKNTGKNIRLERPAFVKFL